MASYRNIQMSFWTDAKVLENFTAMEKYVYLYLLTNPHTSLCGCYEISFVTAATETALKKSDFKKHIQSLIRKGVIAYSEDTNEVLLLHWHKYNWTSSEKLKASLEKIINHVKCLEFQQYLMGLLKCTDMVSIPYGYGTDTSVSVSVSDINTNTNNSITNNVLDINALNNEFEEIWKLYPRKHGKDKAREYYIRDRKAGAEYEEIGKGVLDYANYVQAEDIELQYMKMGSTFFSQKAWQDDWTIRSRPKEESRRDFFARLIREHEDDI